MYTIDTIITENGKNVLMQNIKTYLCLIDAGILDTGAMKIAQKNIFNVRPRLWMRNNKTKK